LAEQIAISYFSLRIILSLKDEAADNRKVFSIAVCFGICADIWIYGIYLLQGARVFPEPQYLLVTTYNPVFAILRYEVAHRMLGLKKTKLLRVVFHAYLYTLFETNLNRLEGSILFTQSGGKYNYLVGAWQEICGFTILVISSIILLKLIERNTWVRRIYREPESLKLAMILSGTALAVFALMVAVPAYMDNDALANAVLSLILLLVSSSYILWPALSVEMSLSEERGRQVDSLNASIENFNSIKHDIYNVLATYSGYLEVGDMEKLKKYHAKVSNYTINAGQHLEISKKMDRNPLLATLLMRKADYAKAQDVKIQIQIQADIGELGIDDLELCRVLSCISDNAIEAASKSARKSVMIAITNNHQNSSKTITVANSTPEPVDISKITTLGLSTKEGHMGIGVNNAIKIANSLESCHLEFKYYDYELTASLDIKNRPVVQHKTIFGTAFSGSRYKSAPVKKY
jgi:hypothetical protein